MNEVTKEVAPGIYLHRCQHVHRSGKPCGYVWTSKSERPFVCSKCKNARWDVPRGRLRQDVESDR